ncbi:MAG TPA: hypothetical protein VIO62_09010, partial [Candidatus Dormibacteraeota bacterium]
TDLNVRCEGGAAVGAERAPELSVVVGDTVRVTGTASAEIQPRVVPNGRKVAGGLIERDLR